MTSSRACSSSLPKISIARLVFTSAATAHAPWPRSWRYGLPIAMILGSRRPSGYAYSTGNFAIHVVRRGMMSVASPDAMRAWRARMMR